MPRLYICSVVITLFSGSWSSLPGACLFLEAIPRSIGDLQALKYSGILQVCPKCFIMGRMGWRQVDDERQFNGLCLSLYVKGLPASHSGVRGPSLLPTTAQHIWLHMCCSGTLWPLPETHVYTDGVASTCKFSAHRARTLLTLYTHNLTECSQQPDEKDYFSVSLFISQVGKLKCREMSQLAQKSYPAKLDLDPDTLRPDLCSISVLLLFWL